MVPFYEEVGGGGGREAYDAVFEFGAGAAQLNGMGGQPEGYPPAGKGMGWERKRGRGMEIG